MQNTNRNNSNSSKNNHQQQQQLQRQRQVDQYQSITLSPLQYQSNTHESIVLPSQQPKRGRSEHFNSQFQRNINSRPVLLPSSRDNNNTTNIPIPIILPSSTNSNNPITSSSNSRMFSPNPVSPLYPVVTTPSSALSPPTQHHQQQQQQLHKKFKTSNSGSNTPITGGGIGSPSTTSYLANSANISYTRSQPLKDNNQTSSTTKDNNNTIIENEDQKFFRLAKEALVATAKGVKTNHSNNNGKFGNNTSKIDINNHNKNNNNNNKSDGNETILDSTIADLLRRLQYASAPHGNPIGQISGLQTNSKGLLEVQDEYSNFPDLQNNNFFKVNNGDNNNTTSNSKFSNNYHHPSGNEPGWNFLLDEASTKTTSNNTRSTGTTGTGIGATTNIISESESELKVKRESSIANIINPSTTTTSTTTNKNNNNTSSSTKTRKYSQDPTRKFPCDKCPMSFRRSSDLKRHEKQHLTIPPNICQFCGKGFARKDALKRHIGTLTCKRNADKKLYIENLNYLNNSSQDDDDDEEEEDEEEEEGLEQDRLYKKRRKSNNNNQIFKEEGFEHNDDDDDDDEEDEVKREFPTYGYQQN